MPQVDFLFSEADVRAFMQRVFDGGGFVVPDLHYPEQNHPLLKNVQSLVKARKSAKLFFILHDDYFLCPLEMRQIKKEGEKPFFFIMQRNGGPTIDFYWAGEIREKGEPVEVGSGYLGYHPTFWNTRTQQNERPPNSLLEFYRKLATWIKGSPQKATGTSRTYFIGSGALALENAGAKLLHVPEDAVRKGGRID